MYALCTCSHDVSLYVHTMYLRTYVLIYNMYKMYEQNRFPLDLTVTSSYFKHYTQDFDILGDAETMIPEAECFRIISEVCGDLKLSKRGKVWFRVNHCGLLLSILEICGVKDKVTQEEVWKILGQAEKNADYKVCIHIINVQFYIHIQYIQCI